MERKNPHWLAFFIVAAFAVCGGFVAGSLLGIRERGSLKAGSAALAQSETRMLNRLSEVESENGELSAELEQARNDVAHWRAEYERQVTIGDRRDDPMAGFHPPMVLDVDSLDAERRIVELECEVALLKELVSRHAGKALDGPPFMTPPTGMSLANATGKPSAREQCSAITKKGVRCSRAARSNGKCWQHGG